MPAVQLDAIRAVCNPVVISPDAIQHYYRQVNTVASGETGHCAGGTGVPGQVHLLHYPACPGEPEKFLFSRDPCAGDGICRVRHRGDPAHRAGCQFVGQGYRPYPSGTPPRDLGDTPSPSMLRVGMMNPATVMDILDDLIDAFVRQPDIPVPSPPGTVRIRSDPLPAWGGNIRLRSTRRLSGHSGEEFPDITLMTDMIVGFCGETEDEFTESLALIDRIRPNKVNITRYSQRPADAPCPMKRIFRIR